MRTIVVIISMLPLVACESQPAGPSAVDQERDLAAARSDQDGTEGIPALIEALSSEDSAARERAADGLASLGVDAVPALTDALSDPDAERRRVAAEVLMKIGEPALPLLTEALSDCDSLARHEIFKVLNSHRSGRVATCLAVLRDPNSPAQVRAAEQLLRMGKQVIPDLVREATEPPRSFGAGSVLVRFGGAAVPELAKVLDDEDASTRLAAVEILAKIGRPALQPIIRALADENIEVCREAEWALSRMGPAAKHAAPALLRLCDSDDPERRYRAAKLLSYVSLDPTVAIPGMLRVLQEDESDFHREEAAEFLIKVAPSVEKHLDKLLEVIENEPSDNVRVECVKVLGGMSPEAMEKAVPTLGRTAAPGITFPESAAILLRNDVDYEAALPEIAVRVRGDGYAERLLITIGKPAVPHLIHALGNEDSLVRGRAAATLGRIGPDAAGAAPTLVEAFDDDDDYTVEHAATAVAQIQAKPEEVVGPLIKLLDHEEYRVRSAAARALGSFGPSAKEAVPRLQKLLKTESIPRTRLCAQEALSKIASD